MPFAKLSMSLKNRLFLSLLIPALLLIAMGVAGFVSVRVLAKSADRILSNNYRSIQASRQMERALLSVEPCVLDKARCDGGQAHALESFEKALGECEANITESAERPLLQEIRAKWEPLRQKITAINSDPATAETSNPLALYDKISRLIEINERAMYDFEKRTGRRAIIMTAAVSITSILGLAALFAFTLISAQRISKPIIDTADDLKQALAHSDKSSDESGVEVDEIRRLRTELGRLLARLARYESDQSKRFTDLQDTFYLVSDRIREGLLLLGDDFSVLYANSQARAILKLRDEDLSAESLKDFRMDEQVGRILEPVFTSDAHREIDLAEVTLEIGGEKRTYRPRFFPGKVGENKKASLLIFWDVTEQLRFEEARRGFIAMLSHQLKTPITSLTLSVNLLRERLRDVPDECVELLDHAKSGCHNLSMLVSELIDTARETAPEFTLHKARVDLADLLRNALRPLKPQAAEKGVTIKDDLGAEAIWAGVDPVKFSWVVANTVGNSLRYTPAGGTVTVAMRRDREKIHIEISDTGAGIEGEKLRRIFIPPEPSELRDPGSHGLGLSIAKEIVESHRGAIDIQSAPGQGTTVHIAIRNDGEQFEPHSHSG